MTKAILGLGAFIASGAALAQSQDTVPLSSDTQQHSLFATESTRALLGDAYAEKLPEWAGRNVLVLTDKDVTEMGSGNLSEKLAEKFPDFPIHSADATMLMESVQEISSSPSAYAFRESNESLNNTHCIIFMNADPLSGQDYFKQTAGIEIDVAHLKTDGRTFWNIMLTHEAYHCNHKFDGFNNLYFYGKTLLRLQSEAEADQFAIHVHSQPDENGNTFVSTHTIEELRNIRSISTFGHGDIAYGIAESMNTESGLLTQKMDSLKSKEMLEAQALIWHLMLEHSDDISRSVIPQLEFIIRWEQDVENTSDSNSILKPFPLRYNLGLELENWNKLSAEEQASPEQKERMREILYNAFDKLMESPSAYNNAIVLLSPLQQKDKFSLEETYAFAKQIKDDERLEGSELAVREVNRFIRAYEHHIAPTQQKTTHISLGGR